MAEKPYVKKKRQAVRKTTSKDVPGKGTAKKTAKAIEARQKKLEKI